MDIIKMDEITDDQITAEAAEVARRDPRETARELLRARAANAWAQRMMAQLTGQIKDQTREILDLRRQLQAQA